MHQSLRYTVTNPMRLDVFLTSQKDMKSRVEMRRLIEDGCVKVGGKITAKPSLQLGKGQEVSIVLHTKLDQSKRFARAKAPSLKILYEDTSCMVIDKPASIAVHPGAGMRPDEPTILHGLQKLFQKRSLPFSASEVLVHRLDKETTGCLLIAKTPKSHLKLQKQFQERSTTKIYLALVCGVPYPAKAIIDAPVGRHVSLRTKMSVMQSSKSREARTQYETLVANNGVALLQCQIFTGRTHQVRVHLAAIGHPILGDGKYCTDQSQGKTEELGIDFLCLHAWKLVFVSPETRKNVEIVAPIPLKFSSRIKRMWNMVVQDLIPNCN